MDEQPGGRSNPSLLAYPGVLPTSHPYVGTIPLNMLGVVGTTPYTNPISSRLLRPHVDQWLGYSVK